MAKIEGNSDKITTALELRQEVRRRGRIIEGLQRKIRAFEAALVAARTAEASIDALAEYDERLRVIEERLGIATEDDDGNAQAGDADEEP
jgi:hypothetical protein